MIWYQLTYPSTSLSFISYLIPLFFSVRVPIRVWCLGRQLRLIPASNWYQSCVDTIRLHKNIKRPPIQKITKRVSFYFLVCQFLSEIDFESSIALIFLVESLQVVCKKLGSISVGGDRKIGVWSTLVPKIHSALHPSQNLSIPTKTQPSETLKNCWNFFP